MRIRKRFPPPPSDPQHNNQVVVQLNSNNESLPSDLPNLSHPQPSDQPVTVTGGKPTTSWVVFGGNSHQDKLKKNKDLEDEKLGREKEKSFGSGNNNDNKKELSFLTPQLGSLLPQSSSSSDLDGRLCEEDDHKVIPLKKRSRDSYHHHNTSNITTMKSKTNKKCPPENGNEKEQEQEHYRRIDNSNSDNKVGHVINKNKSKRGSVLLEGSRCSRVNGRGWRCCQQTLVGYSLCEHHLGKGRLRSMNSTIQNSMNKKKKKEDKEEKSLPNDHEYYGIDDDDEDDKKEPVMATKKKKMKKLGMVKARSLSSLLGQTNNEVTTMVVVDNDNKNQ